nr:hypothetical protein [Mucilaginibacter lappiensis]
MVKDDQVFYFSLALVIFDESLQCFKIGPVERVAFLAVINKQVAQFDEVSVTIPYTFFLVFQ